MPDQIQTVPIPDGATIGQASQPSQAVPQAIPIPAEAVIGPASQAQPGATPGASQITGISAQPKDDSIGGKLSTWSENVSNDIKNGTDVTGVGTVLNKMGAHGVYNGNPQTVGDFMASLPLGLARVAKGTGELAPGSKGSVGQGAKDIVGGGLQAATMPLAVGSPVEAEAAASGAANVAGKVSSAAGKAVNAAKDVAGLNAETTLAKAGEQFNELRGAIGQHTVQMTDKLKDSLDAIKAEVDSGISMPQVVNKFMTRMADVDKGPLTYDEARAFYKNVGDLSASERMSINRNAGRLINGFRTALGETIQNTAEAAGKLEQYQSAMEGWSKGASDAERLDKIKELVTKYGAKAAEGAAGVAGGYGLYRELKDLFGE